MINNPSNIVKTSFQETEHLEKHSTQVREGDSDEILQQGFNFRPVLSCFKRRFPLMVGIFSLVLVPAVLKYITDPEIYQGSFRLLVEPVTTRERAIDPSTLARGEDIAGRGLDYSTQVEILKSPSIFTDIVETIQMENPSFTAKMLRQGLDIQRVGLGRGRGAETKILEIQYAGTSPAEVQLVLDTVAERYLQYSLEERKTSFSQGVQFIESQLPEVRERVEYLRRELENLKQEHLITDIDREGGSVTQRLNELGTLEADTLRQLLEARTLYGNIQQQLAMAPEEAIASATLSEEPRYQLLLNQLNEVEREIATESVRFSEQTPVIQSLRDEQARLSELVAQEAQEIVGQAGSSVLDNPQVYAFQNPTRLALIQQLIETANQMQVLETSYRNITQEKSLIENRARLFPNIATRYTEINQQLQIASKTLEQLLTQRETLRVEAAQNEVPWELIAEPSVLPFAIPPSSKSLILAGGLAVIAAAAAAIALDKYQDWFFTTEDIQDAIQLPVLGVIPFCPSLEENNKNVLGSVPFPQMVQHSQTHHPLFQEAFTSLYASLQFLASDFSLRSLVVCSATPNDGKTTTCLNLAKAVNDAGRRVLLVDTNFRNPSIHHRLSLPNGKGLSDLLIHHLDPQDIIQPSGHFSNMDVVTAGSPHKDAARLLASTTMQTSMKRWSSQYDLVIYDTPHLLGIADASFLAAHSDGIVMVVGVRHTKRSNIMQVMSSLDAYNLPILGIAANNRREGHDSYGYHNRIFRKNLWQRFSSRKLSTPDDNITTDVATANTSMVDDY
jgi:capsular exopolysaccharide synthesis family protein